MSDEDTFGRIYHAILDDMQWLNTLPPLVDNGTTHVYIDTPEGWKCERAGCTADYKHTHGTYRCLLTPEEQEKLKDIMGITGQ